jgi:putative ABC transport system permease protein
MKSYLKFLSRNKLYTTIEAVGLIVSLAFVIIISTSIRDQLGIVFDVADYENLYLVGPRDQMKGEYSLSESLAMLPDISQFAGFFISTALVQIDGENHNLKLGLMDSSLLEMIPLEIKSGSTPPFAGGEGVAITERAARRFFPDRNPIGETVGFIDNPQEQNVIPATITAVIEDPDYTLLGDFDFAVDLQSRSCPVAREIRESDLLRDGQGMTVYFLARVQPGAQLDSLSKQICRYSLLYRYFYEEDERMLTPYSQLYFSPYYLSSFRRGNLAYLLALVALVLLLLISALFSYINLSLALIGDRAKEMATRRLVGEDRGAIFWRVLGESLLFSAVCYLLAIALAFWLTPVLDSLRPTGLNVPFRLRLDKTFWLISAVLVSLVGLLAGAIPAAACASFRPLDVVSGKIRLKRKMRFSRFCIILQSTLSVVLIILTITLAWQLRFLERSDLGVDMQDNLYYLNTRLGEQSDLIILGDLLSASPLVQELGYTNGFPTKVTSHSSGKDGKFSMSVIACDSVAFKMLGFRVKELFAQLEGSIILSESAAIASGTTRDNADVRNIYWSYDNDTDFFCSVVGGVVEDFRMNAVNGNPFSSSWGIEVPVVEVSAAGTLPRWNNSGILLRTTADHQAFLEWFRPTVNAFYEGKTGITDMVGQNNVESGYVTDLISASYDDMRRYLRLVEIFCLISILLSLLTLVAMSAHYARVNTKGIAIRKVFGGTIGSETSRGVLTYMLWVGISMLIGIPLAVYTCDRFLQRYPEHITGYWWIFVLAALLTVALSFASVLWQTLKAARTDPAVELKKE